MADKKTVRKIADELFDFSWDDLLKAIRKITKRSHGSETLTYISDDKYGTDFYLELEYVSNSMSSNIYFIVNGQELKFYYDYTNDVYDGLDPEDQARIDNDEVSAKEYTEMAARDIWDYVWEDFFPDVKEVIEDELDKHAHDRDIDESFSRRRRMRRYR